MPDAPRPGGYVLGFDFGKKRIGVAVGQTQTHTATSLQTVANGAQPDWQALDRLVEQWKPSLMVVGLPLGAEGEETDMSRAARQFGAALAARYTLEVEYMDERLSSHAAGSRFAELRAAGRLRRKHSRRLDAMAAQIILENWLQSPHA
jgi:putative Holliday junction resolvase